MSRGSRHRRAHTPQHARFTLRGFFGLANSSAFSERTLHPSLVATYRLRTVAVGALITAAALVNLVIYMFFSGSDGMSQSGFLTVMVSGIAALAGIILTPWNRVLVTKWALRALYAWSVCGILLINLSIYFDGGGESVLYAMLPILIVFFAIAYPQRAQALLFLVTVGAYCLAVALRGWDLTAAEVYVRMASLVMMAYVASVLSGWLATEMRDRAHSSTTAEQRAGMLDTVARAARRISSLDASHVLGGALSGAMELGCFEAEVWLLDGDPPILTLQRRIAMELSSPHEELASKLFGQARLLGTTQITEVGTDRVVACLLHREGEPAGIFLVRMTENDSEDLLVIECVELLSAQVSAGLDVARNVAERRGLEERLAHWAFHDSLTDLPNRVLFADRLELALARTARDGTKVAVLFLDLDNFKTINDTLGHSAGDELLHAVAHRLHACLRPNDTLARYGGDEFVVLVEHVESPDAAVLVAQRILDSLSRPISVAGHDLLVKTSIGIAMTGARPGADSDVLRRADIAMYDAKARGGSCYVLSNTPASDLQSVKDPHQEEAS